MMDQRDYLEFQQVTSEGSSDGGFVCPQSGASHYTIRKLLGHGACATCFLASDHGDQDSVALKVIRRSQIYPRLSKYVQRELTLHSKLSHPFVVGFKRVFYTEEFLVFVLEYASEGSLANFNWPPTYAQRKPLAIYFFQQLIAAVQYCHQHDIVHRDLKHENTLLHMATLSSGSKFLALKVADFGMCKAAMHSDPKTRVGTIPYMSPQLLRGDPVHSSGQAAGRAADVYACGVHLYKMLFLRYPFDGTDAAEMSQNIINGRFVRPSHPVHQEIEDLLEQMLHKDWQQRITVAGILQHPAYLENLPSEIADGCKALPCFQRSTQGAEDIQRILEAILPATQHQPQHDTSMAVAC